MQPSGNFTYTVNFENEATATAPAQTVTVTEQLDSNLDWTTFQLGDIGFGTFMVSVPPSRTSFSTRVDATATLGVFVEVTANFNPKTGLVTWTLTALDPTTLDLPMNPLVGLLPPNDKAPQGQGFVNYTVNPKAGLSTGTKINAQATVVFDQNTPVVTAPRLNTIDAGPPKSSVSALPPTETSPSFNVSWSGQDDGDGKPGSGIASYDIYVSDNGGPFTPWLTGTAQTSATFPGVNGHSYGFYSVATDNVGNREPTPATAQTTTTVNVTTTGKTTPLITWANPADITYGTTLGPTQLDATASAVVDGAIVSVPGIFAYSPAPSTVPQAGQSEPLTVIFTPNDTTQYNAATATAAINVEPAPLAVTGITANNKAYDATTKATLSTGSAALVGVFSGDTVILNTSGAIGTFASSNVGNGIAVAVSGLTLGGPQSADYTLIQPATTANITPAPLTVTRITANNKLFDGTTTATLNTSSASLMGVIGSDVVTLGTAGATGTFASKDVGNGITVNVSGLTLGGPQAADYTLIQPTTTASITPSSPNNAPLVVLGVSPNAGPAPGTVVQVVGTGFQPGSQVLFGGVPATISGSPTATTLTVVVPALQVGTADVTVVNPDGKQAVLRGAFFALPANPPAEPRPLVAAVSPSAGPASGGTVVNVFGSGFQPGSKVFFGGIPATLTGTPTATILTVVVPALPLGSINVKVVNPDGQQSVLAGAFLALPAPPPVLSALSLNAGPAGTVVQLFGTGFQPGSQVFIGGVLATLSGAPTATTLTVVVPTLRVGSADVRVVNPDGQEAVLPGAFFALPLS